VTIITKPAGVGVPVACPIGVCAGPSGGFRAYEEDGADQEPGEAHDRYTGRVAHVSRGSTLNSPPTHPGSDSRGHHRGLGDWRAAPGCHSGGHHRGLGDRRADDTDSSGTCWPKWHYQSPVVAVA
jgi:hypothetical protein